jgi:putative acetyltransferase
MSRHPVIRLEKPADRAAVRRVNEEAFGGTAEAAIVERLHSDRLVLVSLVAELHASVGHVLFSRLPILVGSHDRSAVALAPLAVAASVQRTGIGSALVRAGLARCRVRGERLVVVLGHPGYYPRFGFSGALAARLRAPFSGESFMALELEPNAIARFEGGEVHYPGAFGLPS